MCTTFNEPLHLFIYFSLQGFGSEPSPGYPGRFPNASAQSENPVSWSLIGRGLLRYKKVRGSQQDVLVGRKLLKFGCHYTHGYFVAITTVSRVFSDGSVGITVVSTVFFSFWYFQWWLYWFVVAQCYCRRFFVRTGAGVTVIVVLLLLLFVVLFVCCYCCSVLY